MQIGSRIKHDENEIGHYFTDEGNYIYRMTKNGKEVIAKAETFVGAQFIVQAIANFKKYELK